MYKLSPSDFAYLYEECKLCYYLKIKKGIGRPQGIFPAIFGAINSRLQGNMVGKDLRKLSDKLPAGIVESQEGFVKSALVPDTNVYVGGRYDLLVRLEDGTYMIVDLKLSAPNDEKIAKYQSQLCTYAYAFEHPAEGEPKKITRAGLLMFYPDTVSFAKGSASLTFPPKWLEVPVDGDAFMKFIQGVNDLLEGPMPPENPDCEWCKYRHLGDTLTHTETASTDDTIPF